MGALPHDKLKAGTFWLRAKKRNPARLYTFASFPVIPQHVAVRAGAEGRSQRIEAGVGTAKVVPKLDALVQVLARVAVRRQLSSRPLVAAAFVGTVGVAARALAWAVSVSQETFVMIWLGESKNIRPSDHMVLLPGRHVKSSPN